MTIKNVCAERNNGQTKKSAFSLFGFFKINFLKAHTHYFVCRPTCMWTTVENAEFYILFHAHLHHSVISTIYCVYIVFNSGFSIILEKNGRLFCLAKANFITLSASYSFLQSLCYYLQNLDSRHKTQNGYHL